MITSQRWEKLNSPITAWVAAVCLGLVHAAGSAFASNSDGNSYMHLADFISRGDWSGVADGTWSPGYPALIGFAFRIFRPAAYWELPLVHAINFVCFLTAFAAFRFFLNALRRRQREKANNGIRVISLDEPATSAAMYLIFFVTSLDWIGLRYITPDMLVAAALYAASGIALRIQRSDRSVLWFGLGCVVGAGYLMKAVMFPLGLLLIVAASITTGGTSVTAKRAAAALIGFFLVSSPQIVAVSKLLGRPAYSGVGGMVYGKDVNHYPTFWTGSPPGSGIPKHPVRLIHSKPDAFEYTSTDPGSSYPVADRPAYWNEGMTPHFDLRSQRAVTEPIIVWYCQFLAPLLFVLTVLYLLSRRRFSREYVFLVVTGLGGLGLFALIYAEPRYIAPWVVVLFASVVSSMVFSRVALKSAMPLFAALAFFDALHMLDRTRPALHTATHYGSQSLEAKHPHFVIASKVESLGLKPGDHVASIGSAWNGYWARLAKVQIAMEVPDSSSYWSADDSVRAEIAEAFGRAGAVAIVASGVPARGPGAGWIPLGVDDYYLFKLK